MSFRSTLLLRALTCFIAVALWALALQALGCTVAPPNFGVGSDRLSKTQTPPADSGIVVIDGDVQLVDGSADGAVERYLDSSVPLAP
jgi:hypothetical protein